MEHSVEQQGLSIMEILDFLMTVITLFVITIIYYTKTKTPRRAALRQNPAHLVTSSYTALYP